MKKKRKRVSKKAASDIQFKAYNLVDNNQLPLSNDIINFVGGVFDVSNTLKFRNERNILFLSAISTELGNFQSDIKRSKPLTIHMQMKQLTTLDSNLGKAEETLQKTDKYILGFYPLNGGLRPKKH